MKKNRTLLIPAGIMMLLSVLIYVVTIFTTGFFRQEPFLFLNLLFALFCLFSGIALLKRDNDKLIGISLCLIPIFFLIDFIKGLQSNFFDWHDLLHIGLFVLLAVNSFKSNLNDKNKKIFMIIELIIGALFLFFSLRSAISDFSYFAPTGDIPTFAFMSLAQFFVSVGTIFCALGLNLKPSDKVNEQVVLSEEDSANSKFDGYFNLVGATFLFVLLLPIWLLIWIYRTTKFTNKYPNKQNSPGCKLLLCIFVPFYALYWVCKQGMRLDNIAKQYKVDTLTMAPVYLILSILNPIVCFVLMQDRINNICLVHNNQSVVMGSSVNNMNNDYNRNLSLPGCLILAILFPVIYFPVWFYKTTKFLNKQENKVYNNPVTNLLLCMFIPFYALYWFSKQGMRVDNLANETNTDELTLVPVYLLTSIIPFVALALMQDRINNICLNQTNVNVEVNNNVNNIYAENSAQPQESNQTADNNETTEE